MAEPQSSTSIKVSADEELKNYARTHTRELRDLLDSFFPFARSGRWFDRCISGTDRDAQFYVVTDHDPLDDRKYISRGDIMMAATLQCFENTAGGYENGAIEMKKCIMAVLEDRASRKICEAVQRLEKPTWVIPIRYIREKKAGGNDVHNLTQGIVHQLAKEVDADGRILRADPQQNLVEYFEALIDEATPYVSIFVVVFGLEYYNNKADIKRAFHMLWSTRAKLSENSRKWDDARSPKIKDAEEKLAELDTAYGQAVRDTLDENHEESQSILQQKENELYTEVVSAAEALREANRLYPAPFLRVLFAGAGAEKVIHQVPESERAHVIRPKWELCSSCQERKPVENCACE